MLALFGHLGRVNSNCLLYGTVFDNAIFFYLFVLVLAWFVRLNPKCPVLGLFNKLDLVDIYGTRVIKLVVLLLCSKKRTFDFFLFSLFCCAFVSTIDVSDSQPHPAQLNH